MAIEKLILKNMISLFPNGLITILLYVVVEYKAVATYVTTLKLEGNCDI